MQIEEYLERLDEEGKMLESIIRQCETKAKQNEDNPKLYLAYVDRIIKTIKKQGRLAKIYLEMKQALEDSKTHLGSI